MQEIKEYNAQIELYTSLLSTITDDKEYDNILVKLNYYKCLRNALENRLLRMSYSDLFIKTMEKLSTLDEEELDFEDEDKKLI